MDAATVAAVASGLAAIAKIVQALGPGGIIALVLAWPLLMVLVVTAILVWSNVKLGRLLDAYRTDLGNQFEAFKAQTREAMDSHAEALRRVSNYYDDNVKLVQSWERIADGMQDVVVSNTRAMERLSTLVENNMFCPEARKGAGGR